MRAVVQRVQHASVWVDGEVVGQIGTGMLVLLGVDQNDTGAEAEALASKLVGLRIFSDEDGRFNLSLRDVDGAMLVVSQFTLHGDVRRGRRPSFTAAAAPDVAEALIDRFVSLVRTEGFEVATGRFGAMMAVDLRNDGPFTLIVEAEDGRVR